MHINLSRVIIDNKLRRLSPSRCRRIVGTPWSQASWRLPLREKIRFNRLCSVQCLRQFKDSTFQLGGREKPCSWHRPGELSRFENSRNVGVITELRWNMEQTPMKSFRFGAFEFRSAIHRRHTARNIPDAIVDNRMVHGKPRRESATHPLGLSCRSMPERPAGATRFQKGV